MWGAVVEVVIAVSVAMGCLIAVESTIAVEFAAETTPVNGPRQPLVMLPIATILSSEVIHSEILVER